ncbi:MAG TPA: hypothetical protein VG474_12165 [Solirubrobacteraceae bacterium]|nr:hypothetical protein [Solirubrobacteraceae bacterium]
MSGPPFAGTVRQGLRLEWRTPRTRALAIVLPAIVVVQYVSEAAQGSLGVGLGTAAAANGLAFAIALLAPLAPALAQATQRELGVDRERHLDGLSAHRLAASTALASIAVIVAVVAGSLAVGGVLGAVDAMLRPPRPGAAEATPSTGLAIEGALATIAAAAAMAGMGAARGLLFASRLAAAVAATVLAGAILALDRVAAVYSNLEAVVDATPQGAALSLVDGTGSSASARSVALPAALLAAWLLVAALVGDRELRRRPAAERVRRRRGRATLQRGWAVASLGMLALPVGFVAPVAMRDEVPWYLRPQWIGDQLAERASDDIVRAFVRAVAAGDERAARALTVDRAGSRLLGPFRRDLAAQPAVRLRTVETREERPGTVVIDLGSGALADQLKVCMSWRSGRWLLQSISSAGVCR